MFTNYDPEWDYDSNIQIVEYLANVPIPLPTGKEGRVQIQPFKDKL